jgi:cold-inducible RNA-binding protein
MEYFANLVTLLIVCFLVYTLFKSQRIVGYYDKSMHKMDVSIQRQEQANHYLNQMVHELRRSNQYLAELVGLEDIEQPLSQTVVQSAPSSLGEQNASGVDSSLQTKIYVGNIDYSATEAELAEYFSQYGQVESVNIPLNRYTGKARGFGFVSFASQEAAEQSIALNGTEFKGRQIQVNFAKEREKV